MVSTRSSTSLRTGISHRFFNKVVGILNIEDPAGTKQMHIEHNHSDKRAVLRMKGDADFMEVCDKYFSVRSASSGGSVDASTDAASSPRMGPSTAKKLRLSLLPDAASSRLVVNPVKKPELPPIEDLVGPEKAAGDGESGLLPEPEAQGGLEGAAAQAAEEDLGEASYVPPV